MGIVAVLVPVSVIVLTGVERKVIGSLQMRLGPMRVGPYGTLQGIADTIKLLTKEDLRPQTADRWTFELAPFVIVVPVFLAFVTLPLRAAAQLISYEIPLLLAVLAVAMLGQSLNLAELVDGQGRVPYIVWQPLPFFIFVVAGLAELYRQPFDIPVAESG